MNDYFCILLAFVIFIVLSYSFVKRAINSILDKKIHSVELSVSNAEKSRKEMHDTLISLKTEYEETKLQSALTIQKAQSEAEMIIKETEEKILALTVKSEQIFEEYKARAEETMIENLKGEVLVAVLSIIESEALNNPVEKIKNIENSKKLLKKIWN